MDDDLVVAGVILFGLWWLSKKGGLTSLLGSSGGVVNVSSASGQVPNYSASTNAGTTTSTSTTTSASTTGTVATPFQPVEGKASSIADQTSIASASTTASSTTASGNQAARIASSSTTASGNQPARIASSTGAVTVYTASNGQHVTVNEAQSGYIHPPQWQVNQLAAIQSEPTPSLSQIQAENQAAKAVQQSITDAAIQQAHAQNLSANYTGYYHVNLPNGSFSDIYVQNGEYDGIKL